MRQQKYTCEGKKGEENNARGTRKSMRGRGREETVGGMCVSPGEGKKGERKEEKKR